MRVPYTINKKILELYQPLPKISKGRAIIAEEFQQWDRNLPQTLRELCVEIISRNWPVQPLFKEITQLSDRLLLLDILPADLPLELTAPVIQEDVYWERCYKERWPKELPKTTLEAGVYPIFLSARSSRTDSIVSNANASSNNASEDKDLLSSRKTWKHYYLEMYLREFLECLPPEDYDPEAIKVLAEICAPYVSVLNLKQLRCPENGTERIPLSAILVGLNNLTELSISFQQTYVQEAFSWNIFKTSSHDIKHICKALEKSNLQILRITKSDIDCEKFKMILKSLSRNGSLKEIDFSSCKISDDGISVLCDFFVEPGCLEKVILANNKIGSDGAVALSQAISQSNCPLKHLDLRLNYIGSKGGKSLIEALASPSVKLQKLVLAGCGIKSNEINYRGMLLENATLVHLDLSNNRFGEAAGQDILKGLESNTNLTKLNLRMCDLSSETQHAVKLLIKRNRKMNPKSNTEIY